MIQTAYDEPSQTLICTFSGRMDTPASPQVAQALDNALANLPASTGGEVAAAANVVFDMKDVDYVASSFLRICVTTAKKLAPGHFKLINTSPMLKKTFKMAGMEALFPVL